MKTAKIARFLGRRTLNRLILADFHVVTSIEISDALWQHLKKRYSSRLYFDEIINVGLISEDDAIPAAITFFNNYVKSTYIDIFLDEQD